MPSLIDEMIDNDLEEEDDDEEEEDLDEELSQNSEQRSQHQVAEILEVKLQPELDLNQLVGNNLTAFQNGQHSLQSTLFLVDW